MAEQIATAMRRLRRARHWTQQQLAEQIRAHRSTIHFIERGIVIMTTEPFKRSLTPSVWRLARSPGDLTASSGLSQDGLHVARLFDRLGIDDRAAVKRIVESFARGPASS